MKYLILGILLFIIAISGCQKKLPSVNMEDKSENIPFENKTAENLYNEAIDLTQSGELYEAKSNYLYALQLEGKHPQILNNLASLYQRLKNIDSAEIIYKNIIELYPNFGTSYCNLTHLYNNSNRYEKGITVAKKGILVCKDSIQLACINLNLSISYRNLNDCQNAKKYFYTAYKFLNTENKYSFLNFISIINDPC